MPQTIMIAANDPNITYLLQRYAEESGFRAVSVCQGRDVVDLANDAQPALIILDVGLPGTSGPHMLRRLQAETSTRDIPIVVYSGLDDIVEEQCDGVAGYLPKAVLYDDFVAMLEHTGVYHSR